MQIYWEYFSRQIDSNYAKYGLNIQSVYQMEIAITWKVGSVHDNDTLSLVARHAFIPHLSDLLILQNT